VTGFGLVRRYDLAMSPRLSPVGKSWFLLVTLFVSAWAEDVGAFATLEVDFGAATGRVWGRYVMSDGTTVRSGWMTPPDGNPIYAITRLSAGDRARVRGIVYSPGCALQAFDIAIQEPRSYRYSFACEPIPQIEIRGSIPQKGRLYDGDVGIEAKYVVDWAPEFFKHDDGTVTEIPLGGSARLDDQNQFRLLIPDLSRDKLAGSRDHGGEIRIFVRNQESGQLVDRLGFISQEPELRRTRFGGIPTGLIRPDSGVFAFCPIGSVFVHDEFGFAVRPEMRSACSP
jgi:hypothetical protein